MHHHCSRVVAMDSEDPNRPQTVIPTQAGIQKTVVYLPVLLIPVSRARPPFGQFRSRSADFRTIHTAGAIMAGCVTVVTKFPVSITPGMRAITD
jgi:hypothetical protein